MKFDLKIALDGSIQITDTKILELSELQIFPDAHYSDPRLAMPKHCNNFNQI